MTTKAEEKTWSEVEHFSVAAFDIDEPPSSERLYANGLQQVEVGVELRLISNETPGEDGNAGPITLSETELRSVRLVQYRGGAELPETWEISREDNGYLPYPDAAAEARPRRERRAAPPGTHYINFFVSTRDVPGSLRMALAITRDDDKVFVTNDISNPEFPKEVEITLYAVAVPNYPLDNFLFEKEEQESNLDLFVHVYSLGVRDNQNLEVNTRRLDVQPAGMIQWHDRVDTETHASYAGHAQPGQNTITWNTAINYGNHTPVATVANPREERGAIVLVGRNEIRYHSESAINHNGPMMVTAIDVYGNSHALRVSFKSPTGNGRLELVLSK